MSAVAFLESMINSGRITKSGYLILGSDGAQGYRTGRRADGKRSMKRVQRHERDIIANLYVQGHKSIDSISDRLGITPGAIRQVLNGRSIKIREGATPRKIHERVAA